MAQKVERAETGTCPGGTAVLSIMFALFLLSLALCQGDTTVGTSTIYNRTFMLLMEKLASIFHQRSASAGLPFKGSALVKKRLYPNYCLVSV